MAHDFPANVLDLPLQQPDIAMGYFLSSACLHEPHKWQVYV